MAQAQVWTIYAGGDVIGEYPTSWEAAIFMDGWDRHMAPSATCIARKLGPPPVKQFGDSEKLLRLPLGIDGCRV